jgi:2-aminoadipate transaminase
VTLPAGLDGRELFLAAQQRGVRYSSGELFHSNAGRSHSLRLTYSTATPSEIERGVEILGALIRERWPADSDSRERKPVQTMPIL